MICIQKQLKYRLLVIKAFSWASNHLMFHHYQVNALFLDRVSSIFFGTGFKFCLGLTSQFTPQTGLNFLFFHGEFLSWVPSAKSKVPNINKQERQIFSNFFMSDAALRPRPKFFVMRRTIISSKCPFHQVTAFVSFYKVGAFFNNHSSQYSFYMLHKHTSTTIQYTSVFNTRSLSLASWHFFIKPRGEQDLF